MGTGSPTRIASLISYIFASCRSRTMLSDHLRLPSLSRALPILWFIVLPAIAIAVVIAALLQLNSGRKLLLQAFSTVLRWRVKLFRNMQRWHDPSLTGINRVPMHTPMKFYDSSTDAMSGMCMTSRVPSRFPLSCIQCNGTLSVVR